MGKQSVKLIQSRRNKMQNFILLSFFVAVSGSFTPELDDFNAFPRLQEQIVIDLMKIEFETMPKEEDKKIPFQSILKITLVSFFTFSSFFALLAKILTCCCKESNHLEEIV